MRDTDRAGVLLIGFGIAFLVFALSLLPMLFEMGDDRPSLSSQLFNTYGIGIGYLLFGLLLIGWGRLTRSSRIPFRAAAVTAGIAITAIIGIGTLVPLSTTPTPSGHTVTLENWVEIVLVRPDVWIGWYFAWFGAYNFAETRYQRRLSIAGAAIVPLAVAAGFVVQGTGSPGAWVIFFAVSLVAVSLLAIPVTGLYSLPFYCIRTQLESATTPGMRSD